jgi:hypothetical protein
MITTGLMISWRRKKIRNSIIEKEAKENIIVEEKEMKIKNIQLCINQKQGE